MNTLEQYLDIISKAKSVFLNKNEDYGSAWRILRTSSLTDQIYIKVSRIRTLEQGVESKVGEGIEGEYIAVVNYSIMALIQLEYGPDEKDIRMANARLEELYNSMSAQALDLMQKKNNDYGEAWRDMRSTSITDLILVKLLRIKQIEENDGQTIVSEGLDSNYLDILNYAVFALIKMSEKENQ